ncbi:MAG: hypothetical protein CVU59_01070 [Deltaproteobacteria bacterium HGW-Deltaproteobacteria-17]|jgi:hypothetical protein|nr:MAG: hypothetical protein CVU59_01070 [Deltaproteobacteria bacterium HGW-Deltaproteobacteria-17]
MTERADVVTLTYLVYDSSLESEVMEFLSDFEIRHFTQWLDILGKGGHSEPRLNSHTWPGTNHVVAILADKATEDHLYTLVAHVRKKTPGVGIKAFTVPVLRHS